MARVKLELWMWMGKELGRDFYSPSEMSSILETEVEDGTVVRAFFNHLADHYPPIAKKVFDRTNNQVYPNVVVTFNDRVIGLNELYNQILKDGDKVKVVQMYVGG